MSTVSLAADYSRWLSGEELGTERERRLFDADMISDCEFEFGPHDTHGDCARILADMDGGSVDSGWNDTWEDNMNTSSHIGFSVFS
jgi:hypothetical protein